MQLSPKHPAAYENLGRLYQERADAGPAVRAKALDVYRQLLDVEPANVEGLFQSGLLLALERQFAASRAALDRLPEAMRRRPQTLAILAADFAALGDSAAARRAVDALAGTSGAHRGRRPCGASGPARGGGRRNRRVPARGAGPPGAGLNAIATHGGDSAQRRQIGEARQVLERVAAAEGTSAPLRSSSRGRRSA